MVLKEQLRILRRIDNLNDRLIFDVDKKGNFRKERNELVKLQNLVGNVEKYEKYSLANIALYLLFSLNSIMPRARINCLGYLIL